MLHNASRLFADERAPDRWREFMAFTVVPLFNVDAPSGLYVPLAGEFIFQELPSWVKDDHFLDFLGHHDRESIKQAKYGLIAKYEAAAIGEPDPSCKGVEPKTKQEVKSQSALFANLAIWLRQPSPVCFTNVLHALEWDMPGQVEKHPLVQQAERRTPLYCHPNDERNQINEAHLKKAAELHRVLLSIPQNNAVWTAVRALWAGLTAYASDIRYLLFWIALEGLFGADDNSGEIAFKLGQRIAFFIANNPKDAREIFQKVKKAYAIRSRIVHGKWKHSPEIDERMADTESITRTAFRHLLEDQGVLKVFVSSKRDRFLEDWGFFEIHRPAAVSSAIGFGILCVAHLERERSRSYMKSHKCAAPPGG